MSYYQDLRLTDDKKKVLYILSKYSVRDEARGKIVWAKEITLLVAVFRVLRHDLPYQKQILIIRYSNKSEAEKQAEIEPLKANKIFDFYRFAPMYRMYQGNRRLMNICQDMIEDLADMVKDGLIQKFKIGTAKFTFENAFILTRLGYEVLAEFAPDHDATAKAWKDTIDSRLSCVECHAPAYIILLEDKIGYVCRKHGWKHFDPSLIFHMQDFDYESKPFSLFDEKEEIKE